jgi:hypothetical protein
VCVCARARARVWARARPFATVMLDGGQYLQRGKNSPYQSVMLCSNKQRNGAQLGAAFNNFGVFEFHSYWPSFVCVDSCNGRCECVVTVVWSNAQSTAHTVKDHKILD